MTKEHIATSPKEPGTDSSLAITSMVLGVVSLTGPGLLLGIPAIITAAIALRRKLAGRGLAIAGLITGIISTVMSVVIGAFIAFLIALGISHPEYFEDPYPTNGPQQRMQDSFDSSET